MNGLSQLLPLILQIQGRVRLIITDVNDNPPSFINLPYRIMLDEVRHSPSWLDTKILHRRIYKRERERETDRQTDRQTDIQRHRDRQRQRQTDRQTENP